VQPAPNGCRKYATDDGASLIAQNNCKRPVISRFDARCERMGRSSASRNLTHVRRALREQID